MSLLPRGASSSFRSLVNGLRTPLALLGLAPAVAAQIGSPTCPAAPNSTGSPASIEGVGSAGADDDAFALRSSSLPPSSVGYFLAARAFGSSPNPLGSGDFCLGGSIGRFSNSVLGAGASGEVALNVDLTAVPLGANVLNVAPGDTLHFQYWYRDVAPGGGATTNLSPGLEVTFHAGEHLFAAELYAVGGHPDDLVLADFDGDGVLDLAVANSAAWDPGMSVARGDGRGGFGPRSRVALPTPTGDIASGDFDGDGIADLAAGLVGGDVAVALGRGDGTFDPPLRASMGSSASAVTLRDLDGDGLDDVVALDHLGGQLAWRQATTAGFGPLQTLLTPPGPQFLELGDVDGDGQVDAIVLCPQSTGSILALGAPGGGFGASSPLALPALGAGLALGDLDGNGTLDLAAASFDFVFLYENDGSGRFALRPDFYPVNGARELEILDLDGDGFQDLVAFATGRSEARILRGFGPGPLAVAGGVPLVSSISAGDVGDLDLDGDVDLVATSNPTHRAAVALNDGGAVFAPRVDVISGFGIQEMAAADFDGDGALDLAMTSTNTNDIGVILSPTSGTLVGQLSLTLNFETDEIAVGDLVGGSAVDIVAVSQQFGNIAVIENQGAAGLALSASWASGASVVDAAVLERAGASAVIVTCTDTGALEVWSGTGTSMGTTQAGFPVARLLPVDLDGDGVRDELVAAGPVAGAVRVAVFTSPGLTPASIIDVPGEVTSLAAGDFDVDGFLDVVVLSASTSTVSLLTGDGAGALVSAGTLATASLALDVALADVDGDGRVDVVVAHRLAGTRIYRNSPWAPFAEVESHAFIAVPDAIVVGDFGGDGRPDLAARTAFGASLLPGL